MHNTIQLHETHIMSRSNNQLKQITGATINGNVKKCRYEVRGEIYLAGLKRSQEGKEVINLNVGNPQALGQKPLTFNRQVLALLMAPFLMENEMIMRSFPSDAVDRAKSYLQHLNGGLGAYSDSKGNLFIRQEIASFISRESGFGCDPNNIFLSNGASECARMILSAIIRGPTDGVMVPIPQYPLYSASIALYGGELVPYYLEEDGGWALNIDELQRSLDVAKSKGITCRALVFINPGNPTGQCLTTENIRDLIYFCYHNRIILCADEVYQENIYNPSRPFVSARKVLASMNEEVRLGLELISFHTVSKGAYGECGLRGGYMELLNFDETVMAELYKIASINLCPNVPGQVALGLMVNPPRPGDPSYELFRSEKDSLIDSLKRRASKITEAFNSLEGIRCQETEGAMYSFPRITLPPAAIIAAKERGKSPDVLYCLELLEETGLSCVPGSGFQQAPGTFHIRTTILPPEDLFDKIIDKFRTFHQGFLRRYSGSSGLRAKL